MARNITVTFADGTNHVYQNAPDDVTPDMVQARAEKEFSKQVKALDGGNSTKQVAQSQEAHPVQAAMSGVNKGFYTAIPGIPADAMTNVLDLGKAGIGYLTSKVTGDSPPEWTQPYDRSKIFGTSDYIAQKMRNAGLGKAIDNPSPQDRLSQIAYGAGNAAGASALSPASSLKQLAGNMVTGAASGAGATGAAQYAADNGVGQTGQTLAALAGGIGGAYAGQKGQQLTGKGASYAVNLAKPKVDPNIAALAQKAADYNIPLRPDMLFDNKIAKMIGEASEKVPLSGSKVDARQEAFNKAIIKEIGGDASSAKLTPDVYDAALKTAGKKIGDISERTPIPVDQDFTASVRSRLENASKFETSDVQKVLTNYAKELFSHSQEGVIPGEAFRKINSKIGKQIRSTSNGDLKNALGELQETMQDALQKNAVGDDLQNLLEARKQYAIAKKLEPLVAKSSTGDISPSALMGRLTSDSSGKSIMARGNGGSISDLARIGQQFIKEPSSSGTAERAAAYGILGGGALAEPVTAASVYSLANLYNRAGAPIVRSLVRK